MANETHTTTTATYTTTSGRRTTLIVPYTMPRWTTTSTSEAWDIVNGYDVQPLSLPLPVAPHVFDGTSNEEGTVHHWSSYSLLIILAMILGPTLLVLV
jgi:hypothetical protein